ncbi:type VI secretion protein IcmF/TssM N-terminal domain-containing protein [Burkholderiaceae bacterium UC74_6]
MVFIGTVIALGLLGSLAYGLLLHQFAPTGDGATGFRWPAAWSPHWPRVGAGNALAHSDLPWLLLIGEAGAGKSSLLASLRGERLREWGEHALAKEPPALSGVAALSLPDGLLWDPDGPAWAAEPRAALRGIARLRPHRPLDGVVWVVSAATLRDADADTLRSLGQRASADFELLRNRLGLLLPVYVVVSRCDALEGFSTFWSAAAGPTQGQQLLGWSAAGVVETEALAGQAMDGFGAELAQLQLHGARDATIADGLAFTLFPRRVEVLREPLHELLRQAFRDQAWQSGFACRGVYFTGALGGDASDAPRDDLAFVAGLARDKLFAERGLARLAGPARWASLRTQRSFQIVSLLLGAVLALGTGWSAYRIGQQVAVLDRTSRALPELGVTACAGGPAVGTALGQIAALDQGLRSVWMPWSWLASAPDGGVAARVQARLLRPVVLPALACKLSASLGQPPHTIATGSDAAARRRAVLADAEQALQLDRQLADYQRLFDGTDAGQRQAALDRLAQGLLGLAPVPSDGGHLAGRALIGMRPSPSIPLQLPTPWVDRLAALPAEVQGLLSAELNAGPERVTAAQALAARRTPKPNTRPGVRDQVQALSDWLAWMDAAWLPLNAERNPCSQAAATLGQQFTALRLNPDERTRLGKSLDQLGSTICFAPLSQTLQTLKLGALQVALVGSDGTMSSPWRRELEGLRTLLAQRFTQVDGDQTLACAAGTSTWQAAAIDTAWSHAREYQRLTETLQLPPLGTSNAVRPLFDQLARVQLERAMNGALRAAQLPAAPIAPDSPAPVDGGMPKRSADFALALQSLLPVQQLYGQLQLTASAANLGSCTRSYAQNALLDLKSLAVASRLYLPGPGSGNLLLDLGPPAVARDYLARQLARAATLVDYAQPFVRLLGNSQAVNDGQPAADQTGPYWAQTATELQRYAQAKDTAGQVGSIEQLVLNQLVTLTGDNCASRLAPPATAAAAAPSASSASALTPGNDLFSDRHAALATQARLSCTATAYANYETLAKRFNDQLRGRYPFAELNAPDAGLAVTKRFFLDYAEQGPPLAASLAASTDPRARKALAFLKQLDQAAGFLRYSLVAGEISQPLTLTPAFRSSPQSSPGSENVISWAFSSGPRVLSFPGTGATTLSWPFGQALSLDLSWPDGSVGGGPAAVWRPSAPTDSAFSVRGGTVSFAFGGDWALLRLIESQRPISIAAHDALDPTQLLLEFRVPTQRTAAGAKQPTGAEARLYLGLRLSGTDPKTQAPAPVTWPGGFPRVAPL